MEAVKRYLLFILTLLFGFSCSSNDEPNDDGGQAGSSTSQSESFFGVNMSGEIKAEGGFVETSGKNVKISNDVKISTSSKNGKTGTWLIDPYDIVIASSGGDISGSTIATALNSNNVILDTFNTTYGIGASTSGTAYTNTPISGNGDITVNDTILKTGSNATTLTLKAHNNININNSISSNSGRLNIVLIADQDN
jgi:hypothetical protein